METKLKIWILKKLHNRGYWSRRPMNLDDLTQGLPSHISKKLVKELADELVKEGLLIKKPGRLGFRYGLNSHKKTKIEELLEI
ncbi:MAG: hypothetical protein U9Q22_00755 [Candidatus Altiarchaeota archaeon]|nr:hypothetical protein [Candidatus Altiarchaeota archaeon]